MIITFDSNVWRKVASPENFPKDPNYSLYKTINVAIKSNNIKAFISETIFTLEAIKKKDRKEFIQNYIPKIKNPPIKENKDGSIEISFIIKPDFNAHPGNNEFLKEHLQDAINLGFNIIHLPLIGGISNSEIEGLRYKMIKNDKAKYIEKVHKVGRFIETLKAGVFRFKERYKADGFNSESNEEWGIIAKEIAEWADGDSIASHIAIEGDYFCTLDKAKKAGDDSILSKKNIEILSKEYGFKTITPSELVKLF